MKKSEFPKVVKIGQTRATIYETPSHDCTAYTVVWYEGAVRKRKAFAELESAELHATIKVNSLSQGEAQVVHLSGEDRLAYVRARDVIAEFGLALDTADSTLAAAPTRFTWTPFPAAQLWPCTPSVATVN